MKINTKFERRAYLWDMIINISSKRINGKIEITLPIGIKSSSGFHFRERKLLITKRTHSTGSMHNMLYSEWHLERSLYFNRFRISKWKVYDVEPDLEIFKNRING